jgi:SAM-dependent methyltransferase
VTEPDDRPGRASEYERRNRDFWDADADDYQTRHRARLAEASLAWGVWRIPESTLQVLGDTRGLDVLEYGCGAAQWGVALAAGGARVVGLDQSRGQLRHAARNLRAARQAVSLVCASGESVPLAAESFDLVFCDHGAMSFCDPYRSVPEVARLLRPGGRLAFSQATPWPYLAWNFHRDRVGRRLRRSYFGMHRFDDGDGAGTIDFQLPYGDWIRLFSAHGLVVDDLVELRAPKHAATTFEDFDAKWARRWPAEHIWSVHRR